MSINLETLEEIDERAEWTKEWVGMPEFDPTTEKEFASVVVRFKTKEDFDKFSSLMAQSITLSRESKKSIWFPKKELPPTIDRFF